MHRGLLSGDDELSCLSSLAAQFCVCVSRKGEFLVEALQRASAGNESVCVMAKCASAVSVRTCQGGEDKV